MKKLPQIARVNGRHRLLVDGQPLGILAARFLCGNFPCNTTYCRNSRNRAAVHLCAGIRREGD